MRLSILIVEDHDALREVTGDFLNGLGHEVRGAADAEAMDEWLVTMKPDVVVLDVSLPGEDGYSVCARLRKAIPNLGILMLTARVAQEDRVRGYEGGADMYLLKPTSNEELAAAIHSLGRRVRPAELRPKLQLNQATRTLMGPLGEVALSDAECKILRALTLAPSRQVAYWQLMEFLGLADGDEAKSALEVRMVRLRKKLLQAGAGGSTLPSIRNVGYQLLEALVIQD